jgi:hypothetical protein
MALLGTPNGLGCGWLFAQHQAALGKKTLADVKLFKAASWSSAYSLLFRFEDA